MSKEINLTIILQQPLDGLQYGLQQGKGTEYTIVQAQAGKGLNLTFAFTIQLKQTKGSISLAGPFVQGTPGNRFVYINIGSYAGQHEAACSGRLKVPLPETDFQNALSGSSEEYWFCTVPGRTAEGKPVFATVKPFGGWLMSKQV